MRRPAPTKLLFLLLVLSLALAAPSWAGVPEAASAEQIEAEVSDGIDGDEVADASSLTARLLPKHGAAERRTQLPQAWRRVASNGGPRAPPLR